MRRLGRLSAAAIFACALALPAHAGAFDPALEAKNFAKVTERVAYVTGTPEFQTRLQQQNVQDAIDFPMLIANDPERSPFGNICANRKNECAGDVRFYDWQANGYGVSTPVVFTGRSGAVISGQVWGTAAGPAQRPAVVITTGSVQAPETLYWGLAATLAKAGYVVLTYDVQGQGRSDTFGEAPDTQEGVPSQAGQPFFDGSEDALDFILSTPGQPYDPRPSCGNANGGVGTDHSPKHVRRVGEGRATAFNPMHSLVDPTRVGIAGHSLGAGAVSLVGQSDPRVDAVVAYDNLRFFTDGTDAGTQADGAPACPSAPATRDAPANAKPALGISNDYGLTPTPFTADPDPQEKNAAFLDYSAQNVDSMEVSIRGGTHYESSLIPGNTVPVLGTGSFRGQDLLIWYTQAWLDKYVKGGVTDADARLLTSRWQNDPLSQEVDTNDDPNMYSFYFRSRYDFTTPGGPAVCADMRTGCAGMAADALPPDYSFVAAANTPDGAPPPGQPDGDGDGVPDAADTCPSVAGSEASGCPPPAAAPAQQLSSPQATPAPRSCTGTAPLRGTRRADRLNGTAAADLIRGRRGADRLNGRAGADCIFGGPGRDRIQARDGEPDAIDCGSGRDRVRADAVDSMRRCERRR